MMTSKQIVKKSLLFGLACMLAMTCFVAGMFGMAQKANAASKTVKTSQLYLAKWKVKSSKKGYSYITGTVHFPKGTREISIVSKIGKLEFDKISDGKGKKVSRILRVSPKKTSAKVRLYYYGKTSKKGKARTAKLQQFALQATTGSDHEGTDLIYTNTQKQNKKKSTVKICYDPSIGYVTAVQY